MSHVMPDFTDRLEQQLRSAALAGGARPRRRRRGVAFRIQHARLAAVGAVCLAAALVAVLVSGLSDHTAPRAYGEPLILQTPTVDATAQFANSTSAAEVLGPGARFDHAYPIPAFGRTAFLVSGDRGWCLSLPDPALPEGQATGVTCTTNSDFLTYGIGSLYGSSYVAALPQGVRDPVVQRPGSSPEQLEPSADQGIVTATGLPSGATITSYSAGGAARTITVP